MEELTQLSHVELTDSEVREILTRLGAQEFGVKPSATIADVSECTGATPEVIGRIVADIRAQNLSDRFGTEIAAHAEKLQELDQKVQQLPASASSESIPEELAQELRAIALNRITYRQFLPFLILLGMAMVIGFGVALANKNSHRTLPASAHRFVNLPSGRRVFMDDTTNQTWVIEPNGDRRDATSEEERDAVYRLYRGWSDGRE